MNIFDDAGNRVHTQHTSSWPFLITLAILAFIVILAAWPGRSAENYKPRSNAQTNSMK